MKSTVAVSVALVGTAAAQATLVNQVLSDITTAIKELNSAVTAYNGGPTTAVVAAANKIDSAVTSGAAKINGGSQLALTDTLAITGTVQDLQTNLDSTLNNLVSNSAKIVAAGECQTTVSLLTKQEAGAKQLQEAIANKAPAEARSIASQLGGQVGASLAKAASSIQAQCGSAPAKSSGSTSTGAATGSSGAAPAAGSSAGSSSASPASGSSSGSSAAAPASGSSSSGSQTYGSKPSVTSTVPSPSSYTGAASANGVPSALLIAVAAYLAM